jgi:hypothetical protein
VGNLGLRQFAIFSSARSSFHLILSIAGLAAIVAASAASCSSLANGAKGEVSTMGLAPPTPSAFSASEGSSLSETVRAMGVDGGTIPSAIGTTEVIWVSGPKHFIWRPRGVTSPR